MFRSKHVVARSRRATPGPVVPPRLPPCLAFLAGTVLAGLVGLAPGTRAAAQTVPASAPNRLIHETSPYLLQHAHNPVDWYPWGDEAFARAKRENRPVLLSIGYSTCYWCHVMEKESFEDPAVARVLNQHFVAIKVDREERPEIDEYFLRVTEELTGTTGWPNTVWLTPEGAPWMASTYLPREKFLELLDETAGRWAAGQDAVRLQAGTLARKLAPGSRRSSAAIPEPAGLSLVRLDRAAARLLRRFDPVHGGYRGAPKFPPHGALALLLDQAAGGGQPAAVKAVTRTLDAMWLGGLHDHIGGGFHRYATDARWLVPHFEKMLPDNAQLMRAYTDAYRITGYGRYREAVADIFRWLQREMTSPDGAFHAAIDAGNVGREGEAYVWRRSQVIDVLGPADGRLFAEIYQVREQGNFRPEGAGRDRSANIPHLVRTVEEIAEQRGVDPASFAARLAAQRARLLEHRLSRSQPGRDEKIIASWNGLMILALAEAGDKLGEPRYVAAATRAAEFLRRTLVSDAKVMRTHRAGVASQPGGLEDYAYVAAGFLTLHQATRNPDWLMQAEQVAATMLKEFEDSSRGGFFSTPRHHDHRIPRTKDLRGRGNLPDADGVAAGVLIDLARFTGNTEYAAAARRTLESLESRWHDDPSGSEHTLIAMARLLRNPSPGPARPGAPSDFEERLEAVTLRASTSKTRLRPGESFTVAITLVVAPGCHLYGRNLDTDFLTPVDISWEDHGSLQLQRIEHPPAQREFVTPLQRSVDTYAGNATFTLHCAVDPHAPPGPASLAVRVTMQACDDSRCLPAKTTNVHIGLVIDADAGADVPLSN